MSTEQEARAKRLADALRENLRRRKALAREQDEVARKEDKRA